MTAMNDDQLSGVRYHAAYAAQHASAAYWSKENREFLSDMALDDLRQAALAAGCTLTPIAQEPQE